MVTKTMKTLSKAEKELEHLAGEPHTQDPAEQTVREMRKLAETATFSAIQATEEWGRKTLDKAKEITEDICL